MDVIDRNRVWIQARKLYEGRARLILEPTPERASADQEQGAFTYFIRWNDQPDRRFLATFEIHDDKVKCVAD